VCAEEITKIQDKEQNEFLRKNLKETPVFVAKAKMTGSEDESSDDDMKTMNCEKKVSFSDENSSIPIRKQRAVCGTSPCEGRSFRSHEVVGVHL
jgi:hypothetical protein